MDMWLWLMTLMCFHIYLFLRALCSSFRALSQKNRSESSTTRITTSATPYLADVLGDKGR